MTFEDLFKPSTFAVDPDVQRRAHIMARRQCDEDGHPCYQVIGRKSPIGLKCPRCGCTWAIGPKTEPTLP